MSRFPSVSRAFTADAQLAEVARAVLDGTGDLSDL